MAPPTTSAISLPTFPEVIYLKKTKILLELKTSTFIALNLIHLDFIIACIILYVSCSIYCCKEIHMLYKPTQIFLCTCYIIL